MTSINHLSKPSCFLYAIILAKREYLNMKAQKLFLLPLAVVLITSCSNGETTTSSLTTAPTSASEPAPISLKERLHNAYLDVLEEDETDLRPLVNLNKDDEKTIWKDDRVLLFTLHRYPSSYPEGEEITFSWGESWLCSVKEYANWYKDNKSNIKDPLLRTKQLLGMSDESKNTYISSMWFNPADVSRPAYVTSPTKQMTLKFDEEVTEEYKNWFYSQYYYSYDVSKLPWTRLGYTYDWSEEAKDKYGLSEFIAWKGTTVTVEKTLLVEEFLASLE